MIRNDVLALAYTLDILVINLCRMPLGCYLWAEAGHILTPRGPREPKLSLVGPIGVKKGKSIITSSGADDNA